MISSMVNSYESESETAFTKFGTVLLSMLLIYLIDVSRHNGAPEIYFDLSYIPITGVEHWCSAMRCCLYISTILLVLSAYIILKGFQHLWAFSFLFMDIIQSVLLNFTGIATTLLHGKGFIVHVHVHFVLKVKKNVIQKTITTNLRLAQ